MKKIELYHGSNKVIEKPEIIRINYTKDFSWGFYCTNNYNQAKRWANRNDTKKIVNVYSYEEKPKLKIKKFDKMTDEWLDFIAKCRNGETHEYDIVEGPMADDTVWNYVNDFLNGDISKKAFWELAKFKSPTHQISFHSKKALECLTFIRSEEIDGK